jgi:hypothetical protein
MKIAIGVTLALLLTGCATAPRYTWVHPRVDNARANQLAMQCQSFVAVNAPYRQAVGGQVNMATGFMYGQRAANYEAPYEECLQRSGFQRVEITAPLR